MVSQRKTYDIITFIYLLIIVFQIIFVLGLSKFFFNFDSIQIMLLTGIIFLLTSFSTLIYSILIIILAFRKLEKTIEKIFVLIGSIILPGLLPLIYYFTSLRKRLDK